MRNLLFTLLITVFGNFNFAVAQSVNDSDRRQIERELERQIANDLQRHQGRNKTNA